MRFEELNGNFKGMYKTQHITSFISWGFGAFHNLYEVLAPPSFHCSSNSWFSSSSLTDCHFLGEVGVKDFVIIDKVWTE
jgi:hypothetical protein